MEKKKYVFNEEYKNGLQDTEPYQLLIGAIVQQAYKDLDSVNEYYRETAKLFFLNPPMYVPDYLINECIKRRSRNGKPLEP